MVHKGGMLMIHQDETDIAFFIYCNCCTFDRSDFRYADFCIYNTIGMLYNTIIAFVSSQNPSAACTEA